MNIIVKIMGIYIVIDCFKVYVVVNFLYCNVVVDGIDFSVGFKFFSIDGYIYIGKFKFIVFWYVNG